jgi:thioredoxin reductase (NADPH)
MIQTDALIIGAGPVGLFQSFQLGLLGITSHIVDALPYPGGQCIELYPDKPIYDIPGTPRCTGRELTASLLKQMAPFGATFHLGQLVSTLEKRPEKLFFVETTQGTQFVTKTIVVAAGVGAFQPKLLRLEGLDRFDNTSVFYGITNPQQFADKNIVIVGGEDSALEWASHFASDALEAAPALIARVKALVDAKAMRFMVGQVTGFEAKNDQRSDQLTAVQVTDVDGQLQTVRLDALLVFLGLSPKLGPVAQWGLDMERKQVLVDTEKFSTTQEGIFAVGDINTYPGKKKLILSGFHECALAAFGAAEIVFPDKKTMLEYTTTSSRLHRLLGVAG